MVSFGKPASGFAPRSTLMPGDDAELRQVLRERRAVLGFLPDGLVIKNDAADGVGRPGRREQHFAVQAAMLFGGIELDGVEAFFDGARAFVRRQDAFVFRDHRVGDACELGTVHRQILQHEWVSRCALFVPVAGGPPFLGEFRGGKNTKLTSAKVPVRFPR